MPRNASPYVADDLTRFQLGLMAAITANDQRTPFFVGPDWNYASMQYRFDEYFTAFADAGYQGRLVYEVNFLRPKPWIDDGTGPDGGLQRYGSYPAPTSFDDLITPFPGESYRTDGGDTEIILRDRTDVSPWFEWSMTPQFMSWYLTPALAFRARHHVPMVVDQFGASTRSPGQLEFERDLLTLFEQQGLSYSRWGYNTRPPDRALLGNADAGAFYYDWLHSHTGP